MHKISSARRVFPVALILVLIAGPLLMQGAVSRGAGFRENNRTYGNHDASPNGQKNLQTESSLVAERPSLVGRPHSTPPANQLGVESAPAPIPATHFDEQIGMTFSQSLTSISYNVSALQQTDPNGYGPADLVNGLTSSGYWYQAGLAFDWPYTVGGFNPGFHLIYAVFDQSQNLVFPPSGGAGIQDFTGPVNPGDTVQLSLTFSGVEVIMTAKDSTTGSHSSVSYTALGSSSFIGQVTSIGNSNGYFSGLMTEWWHADQFYDYQRKVTYSNIGFALSSARMWVDEFDSLNMSWNGFFDENSTLVSYSTNPAQLQPFISHGIYEASNAFGLITGSTGCGPTGTLSAGVLSCNGLGPTTISLTWGQSGYPFFGNYQVQESTSGFNGPWTTIDTISSKSNNTDYFRELSPGRNYWWRYIDNAACCASATSNVFEITQPNVSTLSYNETTDTDYRFTWDNLGNYTGLESFLSYQLMESVNGGTYSPAYSNIQVTGNSFVGQLSPDTSYSFYVITTDECGTCSTHGQSSSISNTVSLHTPLALVASETASSMSLDAGQSVSFTCNGVGGVQPYAYSWDFGDGLAGSGNKVDHIYNIIGPIAVRCTITDSLQSTAPSAVVLTVFSDPYFVSLNAIPASIDEGQTVLFVAQVQGGSGGYTYAWPGAPPECAVSIPVDTCSPMTAGTYLISVRVTDSNGFSDSTPPFSFVVYSDPSISFRATPSDLDVGQTLSLGSSMSYGRGPFTYSYTGLPAGCVTINGSPIACNPTTPGSYSITAQVIDYNGFTVKSDPISVKVNPEPIASLSTSSSVIEVGQNLTLTATASGGTGQLSYSYSGLPPGCSSNNSTTVRCAPSNAGSYLVQVAVSDQTGRTVTSTVRVDVNQNQPSPLFFSIPLIGGIASAIAAFGIIAFILVRRVRSTKAS